MTYHSGDNRFWSRVSFNMVTTLHVEGLQVTRVVFLIAAADCKKTQNFCTTELGQRAYIDSSGECRQTNARKKISSQVASSKCANSPAVATRSRHWTSQVVSENFAGKVMGALAARARRDLPACARFLPTAVFARCSAVAQGGHQTRQRFEWFLRQCLDHKVCHTWAKGPKGIEWYLRQCLDHKVCHTWAKGIHWGHARKNCTITVMFTPYKISHKEQRVSSKA